MEKLKEKYKNFTKITNNQSGITLIALIVTIIVLIIIAGISIATLTADNGILRQVNSAKVVQIEGTAREQVKLATAAMRLAIAEASAKDNSYSAVQHANAIQTELLATIQADSTSLDGNKESWTSSGANNGDTEFTITYAGQDYKNACNDDNAEIVYTIGLSQRTIEITNETNTTLKDQNGNNVVLDIGSNEGTESGSGGSGGSESGSGSVQSACGLYFGGKYSISISPDTYVDAKLSYVFYEDGRLVATEVAEYIEGACTYGPDGIYCIDSIFSVSSDGTKVTCSTGNTYALETNNGAVQNEYGFYFGEKYSATIDGKRESFVYYEDGSFDKITTIEAEAGSCTYGSYEISMGGAAFATVSSDGTQITMTDGTTCTLETGSGSGDVELSE